MIEIFAVQSFWCKMKLTWAANNISLSLSTVHLGEFLRSCPKLIYETIIYKRSQDGFTVTSSNRKVF